MYPTVYHPYVYPASTLSGTVPVPPWCSRVHRVVYRVYMGVVHSQ